jgi:hypothetical protein
MVPVAPIFLGAGTRTAREKGHQQMSQKRSTARLIAFLSVTLTAVAGCGGGSSGGTNDAGVVGNTGGLGGTNIIGGGAGVNGMGTAGMGVAGMAGIAGMSGMDMAGMMGMAGMGVDAGMGMAGMGGMMVVADAGAGDAGANTCVEFAACSKKNGSKGLCRSNTCLSCEDETDDGKCATAFGAGNICSAGSCVQGCRDNAACGGKICDGATHSCVACASTAQCQTAVGNAFVCIQGSCLKGDCADTATNCSVAGQVCGSTTAHTCGDCTTDVQCQSAKDRYGDAYVCQSGKCIVGDCHSNADCDNGKACVANACSACTSSAQCGSGKVCDVVKGSCQTGNCATKADCSAGQTCSSSYSCGACASTQGCKDQYGSTYICLTNGSCAVGDCNTTNDCAGGKVCNTTTHACETCSGNSSCSGAADYGTGYVCVSGACVGGNCTAPTADCSGKEVCGETAANRCGACKTDAACVGRYGAGLICLNGDCLVGSCHGNSDCSNGQYCDGSTRACVTCTNDAAGDSACRASGFGANSICLASKCVAGNCHDLTSECSSNGQICGSQTAHTCGDCTDGPAGDTQCQSAYDNSYICLASRCVVGTCHDNSSDCAASKKVCNKSTHSCVACGSGAAGDATCKSEYGNGYLCVASQCVVADCHSSTDCAAGQICGATTPNVCGGCTSGSVGDAQCAADPRYVPVTSPGYICVNSLCQIGECHPGLSPDCQAKGTVCSAATNLCTSCNTDTQCAAEPGYGAGYMCFTTTGQGSTGQCVSNSCPTNNTACGQNGADFCCGNTCVQGNCCVDSDCATKGFGFTCNANNCTSCDAVASNKYFVDPANGSDAATGSGKSNSVASAGCSLKTVTRALALIKTAFPAGAPVGTSITVLGKQGGQDLAGETYPLVISKNVLILTTGGPVTAKVPAGKDGINFSGIGGGIDATAGSAFVIDGTSKSNRYGVYSALSPFSATLNNVTVQNAGNEGVYLSGASSTLNSTGLLVNNVSGRGVYVTGATSTINLTKATISNTTLAGLRFDGANSAVTLAEVTVSNTATYGMHLNAAGLALTISGSTVTDTANHGIYMNLVSTVGISTSTVQNTNGVGIYTVSGVLNVGAGVTIQKAGTAGANHGIYANSTATTAGVVNINVPSGGKPTNIINNTGYGLVVRNNGVINVTGTPNADGTTGTVVVAGNLNSNIDIQQTSTTAGIAPATCTIDGVVTTNSAIYGLHVTSGSKLKLRNSVFSYNTSDGVRIDGVVNADGLSNIDLGADASNDPGKNILQSTGASRNRRSGLCVNMSNNQNSVATAGQLTLKAAGNIFAGKTAPAGGLNCSLQAPGKLAQSNGWNTGCPADNDLGLPTRAGTTTTVKLDNCTYP